MATPQNKSELILDELKRRKSRDDIVEVEEETVKVVIFLLQGDLYAFRGQEVKEILPLVPISYVPGAPEYIPGVVNIRGDIESVLNINRLLGLPDSALSPKSRIAIAQQNGIRSGILLDAVEDVVDIPVSAIKPPLATLNDTLRNYIAGEFMHLDRNVTILDLGRIFAKLVT
jgi:purine-binding chemotaxis protein CheW